MNGIEFDFSGKRVLVTGGTSGIGYGVASACLLYTSPSPRDPD